jgi:drug/metabolite transporter (DMT)-like permease
MHSPSRLRAVLLALLVTFLWSTSWVLIVRGLDDIPALTFAGLRYAIAFLLLLPACWRRRDEVRALSRRDWGRLIGLGLVFYTLTQGGQFLTLEHLEAITFSLVLSFTPILVAMAGAVLLSERPGRAQWAGIVIALGGGALYFLSASAPGGSAVGLLLAGATLTANTGAALLGRAVNRRRTTSPIVVTTVSMGIGGICLLAIGIGTEGVPSFGLASWGIILWLAVVNTALAFTLWNLTLRTLSATESSVVNNTMLIQIAVLAYVFLGERLTPVQIVSLMVAAGGTLLVQIRRANGRTRGGLAPPTTSPRRGGTSRS